MQDRNIAVAPDMTVKNGHKPQENPFGLARETVERFLPPHLEKQLTRVIDLFAAYNQKLPAELRRSPEDFVFAQHFYTSFIVDRNRRAEEVQNERYLAAVDKAKHILPMPTFFVLCMDGRVKVIHTNGFSADTAGALRTPGGMLNEFVREDGVLTLKPDSTYGNLLLIASKKSDFTAQDYDSHMFCAARGREEAATGNYPNDSGLFRDVLHKKEMAQAAKAFLKEHGNGQNVIFIQSSFNPVTGFMYMGLETDDAISCAQNKAVEDSKAKGKNPGKAARYAEYTKDVLGKLIKDEKIISTGQLISVPQVRTAFEKHRFPIDRQNHYVESAIQFWDGIESLAEELSPILKGEILKVYPHLAAEDERSQKELAEREILILTNAFNTYLNNPNHNEMEYLAMEDKQYEEEEHYEYGEHTEEGVKVSEGGHPPYDIPMFVVYGGDLENLPFGIELSSQLVRGNRKAGRVKDRSGQYSDLDEFAMAVVPVVIQEIIRGKDNNNPIDEETWQRLEDINWDDLPKDWDIMDGKQFGDYLLRKGITNYLLFQGIENLRAKMARIYDPTQETSSHLKDLYKFALPIVCDQNRQTHTIIPFVKVGRETAKTADLILA